MTQARGPYIRQATRVAVRLSAEVHHGKQVFTASTRDLSMGGVCLESHRLVPEGDAVSVGLFLVDDDVEDASAPPLQVGGAVAWTAPGEDGKPGAMGIRFEGVSAAQLQGLTRFLRLFPQGG